MWFLKLYQASLKGTLCQYTLCSALKYSQTSSRYPRIKLPYTSGQDGWLIAVQWHFLKEKVIISDKLTWQKKPTACYRHILGNWLGGKQTDAFGSRYLVSDESLPSPLLRQSRKLHVPTPWDPWQQNPQFDRAASSERQSHRSQRNACAGGPLPEKKGKFLVEKLTFLGTGRAAHGLSPGPRTKAKPVSTCPNLLAFNQHPRIVCAHVRRVAHSWATCWNTKLCNDSQSKKA